LAEEVEEEKEVIRSREREERETMCMAFVASIYWNGMNERIKAKVLSLSLSVDCN